MNKEIEMRKIENLITIIFCVIIVMFKPYNAFGDSDELKKIRKAIEEKGADWTAEENLITRMTLEERMKMFSDLPEHSSLSKVQMLNIPKVLNLPDSLDWRDNSGNWVTPVKNQSTCGSCWAFSAVGQIESWWLIHNNRSDTTIDLSEQFLLSCGLAGSCDGGSITGALNVAESMGLPPEWCFEYEASDTIPLSEAHPDWQDYVFTIPGYGIITGSDADVNKIKNALNYHPVSASFTVYEDFDYYGGGVYEHVYGEEEGGHAIVIIGWNDADSCWICKNSWSRWWGENGYFRIKWGECEIGERVPFIWDSVMGGGVLSIVQDSLKFILKQGNSASQQLTLKNSGSKNLEYSASGYSVPIKFHSSNFNAYDGFSWWCSDPDIGGYGNHWLQYLQTPVIDLAGTEAPELNWMGFWLIEDPAGTDPPWDGWDGCNVWISTDRGENFTVFEPVSPEYNCNHLWSFGNSEEGWDMGTDIAGWGGNSGGWISVKFDLSQYKSEEVIIRWAFASDLGWCTIDDPEMTGLQIDDIVVVDNGSLIYENHGNDDGSMSRDGFGNAKSDWMTVVNGMGRILPAQQYNIEVNASAVGFEPGRYKGLISIITNDTTQQSLNIPVILEVEEGETAIHEETALPKKLRLYDNYPNPFNPNTLISYYLPEQSFVKLTIYDLLGREIKTLIKENQSSGIKTVTWHGKDDSGNSVSSGMYIYKLEVQGRVLLDKMILLK